MIPKTVIYLKLGEIIQLHGRERAVSHALHIREGSSGELAAMERGILIRFNLSRDRRYSVRKVVNPISDLLSCEFEKSRVMVAEPLGQDAAYVIDSTRAGRERSW